LGESAGFGQIDQQQEEKYGISENSILGKFSLQ
jgi:hypothetical protein